MIVGIQESFIDYPNEICVMVFTKECNWDCIRCHNKENLKNAQKIAFCDVISYLKDSLPLISHLVISGGEPTIDNDVFTYVKTFSDLGFKVKLDTNGSQPDVLKSLLPYLSIVAMDVKTDFTSFENYNRVTNCNYSEYENFLKSLTMLSDECNKGNIKLILRTTKINDSIDTDKIESSLKDYHYTDYVVQKDII